MATIIQEKKSAPIKRASKSTKKPDQANLKLTSMGVSVDYPAEGEKIIPGSYTIRISSLATPALEVSINGEPWQICRESLGYWWFDWWPMDSGEHKIVARAQTGKAKWKKSSERTCVVIGPSHQ